LEEKIFNRLLDVIQYDIVPLTEKAVEIGCKIFGAAILLKKDLSLVLSGTNHEAFSPLWHGEIYTIKLFYEMQCHPDAEDCIFISTHQPCCMCTSALAWAGFRDIWYLFEYEDTGKDFKIPHDQKMIREIFGCEEPKPENDYFKWYSIPKEIQKLQNNKIFAKRLEYLKEVYARLSNIYQIGQKRMILK
jgi:tRNA(Arg) A34 adenosine deaminase TadA